MRTSLATVLALCAALMLSPASAQTAVPLPPESRAHTTVTASILELLLALRIAPSAIAVETHAAIAKPHERCRAEMAYAATPPAPTAIDVTPP